MRTKTLFLAAAALAAGLASSMAQNVYSINIVGYVNVPISAGTNYLLANPLDDGSNTVSDLGAFWSNGTTVQTFNGVGFNLASKVAGNWGTAGSNLITPGTGFYIKGTKAQTLTFVGQAPTSNNYVLANKVQVLAGSVIPFSGNVQDAGANTLNFTPSFSNGTVVQTFNGVTFTLSSKVAGSFASLPIAVAQGFFLKPGGTAANTWIQSLQ